MSSSNSPCAACKFLRRKCTQGCVFAPYFPSDQPTKFSNVHRVFGASNVAKLLNNLNPAQREGAVTSLAYEAEAWLRDPVHGCMTQISFLEHKFKQLRHDLYNAKQELSSYIGTAAFDPFLPQPVYPLAVGAPHQLQMQSGSSMAPPFGIPGMGMRMMGVAPQQQQQQMLLQEHQQQQMVEAQQLALVSRDQELQMRMYEQQQQQQHHQQQQQHHQQQQQQQHHQQQQQQHELARLNGLGFNHMGGGGAASVSLAAGPAPSELTFIPAQTSDNIFHIESQQEQYQEQQHQHLHHHQRTGSDEGISGMGPSS